MLTLARLTFDELLNRAGLKPTTLAKKLKARGVEVSHQAIYEWKNGSYQPNLPPVEIQILCEELGCSFKELVEAFDRLGG